MSKIYAFDLDETLCTRHPNFEDLGPKKYTHCTPIRDMVDKVNKLYDDGNTIIIFTARGMSYFKGDIHKIYSELFDITQKSLFYWGVKYHTLIMGKPHYDFLIDDKSISIEEFKKMI